MLLIVSSQESCSVLQCVAACCSVLQRVYFHAATCGVEGWCSKTKMDVDVLITKSRRHDKTSNVTLATFPYQPSCPANMRHGTDGRYDRQVVWRGSLLMLGRYAYYHLEVHTPWMHKRQTRQTERGTSKRATVKVLLFLSLIHTRVTRQIGHTR